MSQAKSKSPRSFCWATVLLLGSFTLSTLLHCYFFNASLVSFTRLLSFYQTSRKRICSFFWILFHRNTESLWYKNPLEIFLYWVTHSRLARTIQVLNISLLKTSQSPWATCVSVQTSSNEKQVSRWDFLFLNVLLLPILLWLDAAESVFYSASIRFFNTWMRCLNHLFSTLTFPTLLCFYLSSHESVPSP